MWETVQKKRQKAAKTWPGQKGKRGFSSKQGRYQEHYPTHLLAGAMTCDACGSSISQVSGKSGGYYGCPNARKNSCDNKAIVRRTLAEKIVLNEIRRMISTPEQMCYLFEKVESEIANLHSDFPELIRRKKAELREEEKRLTNYINFIGEGNASRTLNESLLESEAKVDTLQTELDGLRQAQDKVFKAPTSDWIKSKLSQFSDLLERNTSESAIALRKLLGPMTLKAQYPESGKPYYVAHTSINALAIAELWSNSKFSFLLSIFVEN